MKGVRRKRQEEERGRGVERERERGRGLEVKKGRNLTDSFCHPKNEQKLNTKNKNALNIVQILD